MLKTKQKIEFEKNFAYFDNSYVRLSNLYMVIKKYA